MGEETKNKSVLFIATPNVKGQLYSGAVRVEKFAKYLSQLGWDCYCLALNRGQIAQNEDAHARETHFKAIYTVESKLLSSFKKCRSGLARGPHRRQKTNEKCGGFKQARGKALFNRFAASLFVPDKNILGVAPVLRAGLKVIKRHKIAVVIAVGPVFSFHVFGYLLSIFSGKPLVVDYKDSWIDNPFYIRKLFCARLLERRIENAIVRRAAVVACTTRITLQETANRNPACRDKIHLLPNGADMADFDESHFRGSDVRRRDNGALLMGHFGNIYTRRFPDVLIRTLSCINSDNTLSEKLIVYFVGDIENRHVFKKHLNESGLGDCVLVQPQVSHRDYIEKLFQMDILLVIPGADYAVPGKLYEYAVCGRPILCLCSRDSASAAFLRETQTGISIDPENREALGDFFSKLLSGGRKDMYELMNFHPNQDEIAGYDRKVIAKKLHNLLMENVLGSHG